MVWVWGNKGIDKILKLIYNLDLILGLRTNPGNVTLRILTPSLPKIRYCLTYLEKINNKKNYITQRSDKKYIHAIVYMR